MQARFSMIDDALIERVFQPLSDTVTDHSGLDRPWTACSCADVATLAWIISNARGLSDSMAASDVPGTCLAVFILMLGLAALTGLRSIFLKVPGTGANPLRLSMRLHRGVALLMILARLVSWQTTGLSEIAELLMLVFAVSGLYFGACASRPPVRRRSGRMADDQVTGAGAAL